MRLIGSLLLFVILAIGVNACFEEPKFSIVPSISFNNIVFKNETDPSLDDSLIVTINFKDGDGDLGFSNDTSDIQGIYAIKYFFTTTGQKRYFLVGATIVNPAFDPFEQAYDTLISYKTKRKAAGKSNDTLPYFVSPYSCTNWEVIRDPTTNKVTDTLYFQFNPNTYNIFVDFFIKQGDGTYALFDWAKEFVYPNCFVSGYNGRFPVLASDPSKPGPLEGKIRYGMTSAAWTIFFSTKIFYLRIYIKDRALNTSNVITTEPHTLEQITQN